MQRPVESGQYLSIRYTERLAANDIAASVGSVGDCLLTGQFVVGLVDECPVGAG
ncbi:hypothetical protein [Candidatus Poriferisodalis sp.]|uniref:hypothetical protein n=1 Tax=Candidatus Poriferisodalis sp. TaxID=3101277 RepID=UPI003B5B1FED